MRRGYFGANGARITVRTVAVDKLSCASSILYAKKRHPPPPGSFVRGATGMTAGKLGMRRGEKKLITLKYHTYFIQWNLFETKPECERENLSNNICQFSWIILEYLNYRILRILSRRNLRNFKYVPLYSYSTYISKITGDDNVSRNGDIFYNHYCE